MSIPTEQELDAAVFKGRLDTVIAGLKVLAARSIPIDNDDFNAYDYSGGNYDDAYALGETAGEVQLARELLHQLGIDE